MSSRPSLSKSKRAPPDPVDSGMKYFPAEPESCLKRTPAASVMSSNQEASTSACSFRVREAFCSLPDLADLVQPDKHNRKPAISSHLATGKSISSDRRCSDVHIATRSACDLHSFGLPYA